jgi:hypothetical protein
MNLQQKQLIAALLIGCLIGAAAGSQFQKMALQRFWEHGPTTQHLLHKFSRDLSLDAQQQEAVKQIIEKHHDEMISMQKEMAEKFQKIRLSMRADMAKVLNPSQQDKFREMAARWDASHPLPGQPQAVH